MKETPKDYSKMIIGLLVVVVILGTATLYSVQKLVRENDSEGALIFADENGQIIDSPDEDVSIAGHAMMTAQQKTAACKAVCGRLSGSVCYTGGCRRM